MMLKRVVFLLIFPLLLLSYAAPVEASLNRPLVRLEAVSTLPDPVRAGEEFIIKLSLKNEGNQSARAVLLTLLSLEGEETLGGFSPMGMDNTLYLSRLGAGESEDKEIKMRAAGNLEPGVYNLVLALEYLNYQGTRYESRHITGVVVAHEGHLALYNISLPHEIKSGENLNLQGEIVNAGTSRVSNVILTISSDIEFTPTEHYLGHFEPGDMDVFESQGLAAGEGVKAVRLKVSYLDSMNRRQSTEVEREIRIIPSKSGLNNKSANGEGGFWVSLRRFFLRILGLGGPDV